MLFINATLSKNQLYKHKNRDSLKTGVKVEKKRFHYRK